MLIHKTLFYIIISILSVCFVEAESEEEARKIFEDNPDVGDWENWETHDSEMRNWEVDSVEYDEWMTKHMEGQENQDA